MATPPTEGFSQKQPMRGNVRLLMLLAVLPLPLLVGIGAWYQLVLGEPPPGGSGASLPDGAVIALLIGGGVLLPLGFATMHLRIKVTQRAVTVALWPLLRRTIPLDRIEGIDVERFDAFRDFGGWGIKGERGRSLALIVDGDTGVRFHIRGRKDLVVSSDDPEGLAAAIRQASSTLPQG